MEKTEGESIEMCGFRLKGYKGSHEFFCRNPLNRENWIKSLSRVCVSLNITENYTFGKMLGKGSFAKVHLAWRKSDNRVFAIKTVEKVKVLKTQKTAQFLHNEIATMRQISHPNVIRQYEVYENDMYVHIVLEYLKGGELLQRLQNKGTYSEKDASVTIKCILEALSYCHSLNVLHRDLKPENLILAYRVVQL